MSRGVSADQIFACTFTGRSGEELRRRLGLPGGPRRAYVGTFHALASRLLRRFHASAGLPRDFERSEEHTSELQSLMRISYAVFCLKKKKPVKTTSTHFKRSAD